MNAGSKHNLSRAMRFIFLISACLLAGQSAAGASSRPGLFAGIPQSGERLGRTHARVLVTLYGDLECPECRQLFLSRAFAELISREIRPGKARLLYRSLCTATCNGPGLSVFIRQQAAAYAAGAQRRFWQYALLFRNDQGAQDTGYVTETFLDRLAHEVRGLNYDRWRRARASQALARKVRAENQTAGDRGFFATPTLVFTGPGGSRQLIGAVSFHAISAAIRAVG